MSNQEKDVLDFLDSLPQKSTKSANKPSLNKKKASGIKKDNNVLDFLNELEEHSKKNEDLAKPEPSTSVIEKESVEFIETPDNELNVKGKEIIEKDSDKEDNGDNVEEEDEEDDSEEEEESEEEEDEVKEADPISSFTSWFSNAATSKLGNVDNLISQTKNTLQKNLHSIQKPELENLQKGFKDLLTQTITQIEEHVPDFDGEEEEENLKIFLQHDIPNWKFDKLCKETFHKILSDQVQDGVNVAIKEVLGELPESQTFFEGKVTDAEKLCLANIEDTIKRYKEDTEEDSDSESKIFISVVGVTVPVQDSSDLEDLESVVDPSKEGNFSLVFVLKDITNKIQIIQKSQSIPDKWIQWVLNYKSFEEKDIDPSKWVREWIEQLIVLNFQILAQNYVIKRINF